MRMVGNAISAVTAVAVVTLTGLSSVFAAGSSLPYSEGGYIPDFIAVIRQYNDTGDPFRIEGICKSACTMFLGIRNVCVERDAQLMFHAGHDIAENVTGPETRASRAALYRYNDSLRNYLLDGHYMDTEIYHTIPGSMIIDRFGYRACPKT